MSISPAPRTGLIGVPSTHGLALPPDLTFEEWRGALDTADMLVAAGPADQIENVVKLGRENAPAVLVTPRGATPGGRVQMRSDRITLSTLPPIDSWWTRFADKFKVAENGCWIWTAYIGQGGYGRFGIKNRVFTAHRVAYAALVGPIPEGMCLDHVCHGRDATCPGADACLHRRCVNPSHMELVSSVENVMRGQSFFARQARATHCKNGHPFDADNTYVTKQGRHCKTCRLATNRAFWRRKREAK